MRNRGSLTLRAFGTALALALMLMPGNHAFGQCANNNTLLGTAITPPCPGSTNVPCITGGQHALVNVTLGNIYSFSTCGAAWDTQRSILSQLDRHLHVTVACAGGRVQLRQQ